MACCDSLWYCTDGGPVEVLPDVDGIYTPPVGWDGNPPYLTEAEAMAACFPPEGEGEPDCCPGESFTSLTATISGGHGTMTLTWDGSQYWTGSKALSCGETLHFRYDKDCGAPDYSCDGSTWLPCPASIGTPTCTPLADPRTFDTDMDDVNAGCAAGSCGALSVTVAV